jgi:hypothetical protein
MTYQPSALPVMARAPKASQTLRTQDQAERHARPQWMAGLHFTIQGLLFFVDYLEVGKG